MLFISKNALVTTLSLLSLASAQLDLVSVLEAQAELSALTAIVPKLPGVYEWISSANNLTLLLPTNEAIAALPADSWEGKGFSETNIESISAILSLHVIQGVFRSTDFKETPTFVHSILTQTESIGGKPVANVTGGQNVGYVLNGSDATIISGYESTSKVLKADIPAGNNLIIHIIDSVLRIPFNVSTTCTTLGLDEAAKALDATGLEAVADTRGDLTFFIPNNAAFQAIAPQIANVTAEELTAILSYHAIKGTVVFSTDLAPGSTTEVATVSKGNNLTIEVDADGDEVLINGNVKVVTPNIILANGVGHVVDQVLFPPANETGSGSGSSTTPGPYGSPTTNTTNTTGPTTTPVVPYTGEAAGRRVGSMLATVGVLLVAVVLAL